MEEKVIIDLAEYNRLKKIEREIKTAFDEKKIIRMSYTQSGDRVSFKIVNESEVIEGLMAEIMRSKELVESAWKETNRINGELEKKTKKWFNF